MKCFANLSRIHSMHSLPFQLELSQEPDRNKMVTRCTAKSNLPTKACQLIVAKWRAMIPLASFWQNYLFTNKWKANLPRWRKRHMDLIEHAAACHYTNKIFQISISVIIWHSGACPIVQVLLAESIRANQLSYISANALCYCIVLRDNDTSCLEQL